jgi:tetratricopeptide (TPR) repeat protein
METTGPKLPLKLQIELRDIEPSPELQQVAQSYVEQLCYDLFIPALPAVSVQAAPVNQLLTPWPFRISISTRCFRSRWWQLPNLPPTNDPKAIGELLTMALYEHRESLIVPDVVDHFKRNWKADQWPREAFRELLSHFARYNFSLQRAEELLGSPDNELLNANPDEPSTISDRPAFFFEQLIESSLIKNSEHFGIEIVEGPQSLNDLMETASRKLGIFLPKLKHVRQSESQPGQLELRINDVRLPKIRMLASGEVLLRGNRDDVEHGNITSFWIFDPLSCNSFEVAQASQTEATDVSPAFDSSDYARWMLRQVMFANAGSLLAAPIVHLMIGQAWTRSSNLIASFERKFDRLGSAHVWLTAVFRRLLDERVSIRDLPRILEGLLGLREISDGNKREVHFFSERPDCPLRIASGMLSEVAPENLVSAARLGMHPVADNIVDIGLIRMLRLTEYLEKSLAELDGGPVTYQLAGELAEYLGPQPTDSVAIIVSQNVRPAIKNSLRFEFPSLIVLGRAEMSFSRLAASSAETSRLLFEQRRGRDGEALQMAVEAVQEQPLEISYRESLGEIQDRLGHYKEAREQYRIALALAEDPELLMNVADAYWQKQQFDSAIRIYRETAQKFGRPEQYALLGERLFSIRAWKRTIEAYRAAIGLDPQNAYYRASLGVALASQAGYLSAGDEKGALYKEAIQRLDEAIKIEKSVVWFYSRRSWLRLKLAGLDVKYERADQLIDNAESDLSAAIQLDPQSKLPLSIEWAHLLVRLGKVDEAAGLLGSLAIDKPSEFQVDMELAKVYALSDCFEQACQHAEKATQSIDKPDPEAERVLQLLREGSALARKAKDEPPSAGLEAQLGSVQLRLNNLDAALRHYRRASALDDSSTEVHKQLGKILYKQDALAAATEEWLKAGDDALTLNNLGTAYDGLGDSERAGDYYRRALDKGKDNFVPWYNLGSLYYHAKEWDLSRKEYAMAIEKLVTQNVKFAPVYVNRGNCFFWLNEAHDAEKDWREAIQLDPKSPDAHFNLGVLLWASEQTRNEAVQHWREAWLLDPNFTLAEDNLLAAREGTEPKLEIVDLKYPRACGVVAVSQSR